jgi:hypothetical protein
MFKEDVTGLSRHHANQPQNEHSRSNFEPIAQNPDIGGLNFGIGDASWNDAGAVTRVIVTTNSDEANIAIHGTK